MSQLKLNTIIQELADVRYKISELEIELEPLKKQQQKLREALLKELHTKGMKTLNSDITGEIYTRAERFSFKVADEATAKIYATAHDALKIDTTKIAKLLRTPNAPLPEDVGFAVETTEYLSVRSNNQD